MTELLQQLVNGLTLGSLYALIAVGYTVVYGIIQLINFAHGEVFMIGAFGALATWTLLFEGTTALWVLPHHAPRRHHRLGHDGRVDGALRLPSPARRATAGPAHHRDRHLRRPPGGVRLFYPGAKSKHPLPADRRGDGSGAHLRWGHHPARRRLHGRRAPDVCGVPLVRSSTGPGSGTACRRPRRTPTPPGSWASTSTASS